jgi:phosphoenolpyruvate carboxykinase (ATP)
MTRALPTTAFYASVQAFNPTVLNGTNATIHRNLSPGRLYEEALKHDPGSVITSTGALAAFSGEKTGRSPKDKRVVEHPASQGNVWWGKGSPNMPLTAESFAKNKNIAISYLQQQANIYIQDGFVNWGPEVCGCHHT